MNIFILSSFVFIFVSVTTSSPVDKTELPEIDVQTTNQPYESTFRVEQESPTNVSDTNIKINDNTKLTPLPSEEVKDFLPKDVIVVFRQEEEEDEEDSEEEEEEKKPTNITITTTKVPPPTLPPLPPFSAEPEHELPFPPSNFTKFKPSRPIINFRPRPVAVATSTINENVDNDAEDGPDGGDTIVSEVASSPRPKPIQTVQEGFFPIQEPSDFKPSPKTTTTVPPPPPPFIPPETELEPVASSPLEHEEIRKPEVPEIPKVQKPEIVVLPPQGPGKYKITKPLSGSDLKPPSTVTGPPLSIYDEWNITSSIFTLSPQGRADCECGKTFFRVENVDQSQLNLYPWTVAIVRAGIFGGGRPHCGGALINNRYVLSSASCFDAIYGTDGYQVWLTAHNSLNAIDNFVHSDRVLKREVKEIIMHPNFDRRNYDNDIALIKLSTPVDLSTSSYYVPICLPATMTSYDGMAARVTGWGSTTSAAESNRVRLPSNVMCKEDVPVISNQVCNRDTIHKNKITPNQLCAGFLTKQPSETCIGDAGGPLALRNNGRFTMIGLVSFGFTNRQAYSPIVYTRVGAYADWILHNTEDADWCSI